MRCCIYTRCQISAQRNSSSCDWCSHMIAAVSQDAPAQIFLFAAFYWNSIYSHESERMQLFLITIKKENWLKNLISNFLFFKNISSDPIWIPGVPVWSCDPKVENHCFNPSMSWCFTLYIYIQSSRKASDMMLSSCWLVTRFPVKQWRAIKVWRRRAMIDQRMAV